MLDGGESGPAVASGRPDESLLIAAVRYNGLEMPPRSRLPAGEVAILEDWIARGAPWPEQPAAAVETIVDDRFPLEERRSAHWAWQPIRPPDIPAVRDTSWPSDPIDRFILARLEQNQITPARTRTVPHCFVGCRTP